MDYWGMLLLCEFYRLYLNKCKIFNLGYVFFISYEKYIEN